MGQRKEGSWNISWSVLRGSSLSIISTLPRGIFVQKQRLSWPFFFLSPRWDKSCEFVSSPCLLPTSNLYFMSLVLWVPGAICIFGNGWTFLGWIIWVVIIRSCCFRICLCSPILLPIGTTRMRKVGDWKKALPNGSFCLILHFNTCTLALGFPEGCLL